MEIKDEGLKPTESGQTGPVISRRSFIKKIAVLTGAAIAAVSLPGCGAVEAARKVGQLADGEPKPDLKEQAANQLDSARKLNKFLKELKEKDSSLEQKETQAMLEKVAAGGAAIKWHLSPEKILVSSHYFLLKVKKADIIDFRTEPKQKSGKLVGSEALEAVIEKRIREEQRPPLVIIPENPQTAEEIRKMAVHNGETLYNATARKRLPFGSYYDENLKPVGSKESAYIVVDAGNLQSSGVEFKDIPASKVMIPVPRD